jgi:hypothetical protein
MMARINVSRLGDQVASPKIVVNQFGENVEVNPFTGRDKDGNVVIAQSTPYVAPIEPITNTVFLPVATIVTQNGEEIEVDSTGRSADGNVPIGTTKPAVKAPVKTTTPTTTTAADATADLLARQEAARIADADRRDRQSAYDILYNQFNQYGLGSLVEDIKYLIQSNVSPSQFSLELQNTKAYQNRFAANKDRIAKGLSALSPAEYIGLEDQYQNVMRNYGLPASYYTKDATGKQPGFEKFLAGDVSASELEDRIGTAQKRVLNANPEVTTALKQFYPDITNADILAYTLDPTQGLENIKRKVTAAEIGGAAFGAGLNLGTTAEQIAASKARAEMLQGYGVTKESATSGFQTVADFGRGSELAGFYNRPTYGQMEAEQEVFKLEGATAARKKRSEITGLEKATFGGQTGLTSGALARDRAGGY